MKEEVNDLYQLYLASENSKIPYSKQGFFNSLLYLYINKIINLGAKKKFEIDMLYKVPDYLTHEFNFEKFKKFSNEKFEKNKSQKFINLLYKFSLPLYIKGAITLALAYSLQVFAPIFVKLYLQWLKNEDDRQYLGWIFSGVLILISFSKPYFNQKNLEYGLGNAIRCELISRVKSNF